MIEAYEKVAHDGMGIAFLKQTAVMKRGRRVSNDFMSAPPSEGGMGSKSRQVVCLSKTGSFTHSVQGLTLHALARHEYMQKWAGGKYK